jgi:alanine racemase
MKTYEHTHPILSWVRIDTDALRHNLALIKQNIAPGKEIIAVVKANAYGHGARVVASTIENDVDAFAVAQPAEGIELREAGITKPILVLCAPEASWAHVYAAFNLSAVVGDPSQLGFLPTGTPVHLKADTGMNRLGFRLEQVDEMLAAIAARPDLDYRGLMTHLANADHPDHPSLKIQSERFGTISATFPPHLQRHIASSAAILGSTSLPYDSLRLGLILYGYPPKGMPDPGFRPVKKWLSRITQVRPVKAGESVSYGWIWSAPSDGWLGIIPVGYADGYPRAMSNKALVDLIDGPAHQVGRVTMDYTIIWTSQRELLCGEEVTLLGGPNTGADQLAEWAGTINYEILCLSGTIRRGNTPFAPETL